MTKINTVEAPAKPGIDIIAFVEEAVKLKGKSAQIRFLDSKGISRSDIARALSLYYYPNPKTERDQVRYQHVRNVLQTQLTTKS